MTEGEERRTRTDQSGSGETPPASELPCYDVFISYSSRDKAWVRGELLQRIEQAGLKVFIDFRDFTPGAPSIKEMERGVLACTKTVLVLTPDYVKSEWCDFEGLMVQTLSPANRDLRLIPLLKRKCKKPLRIAALTHVDFTHTADLDLAWRRLLTSLGAPQFPTVVTVEFLSDRPIDTFDPTDFQRGFDKALGIKAWKIRIVSVRPGSTVVTVETDPLTRAMLVTALSCYPEAHREFLRLTGMKAVSWIEEGGQRTLSLTQQFVSFDEQSRDRGAHGEWVLAHPYPMPPNFTGRSEERKMLTDWLDTDAAHPLLVLRALGGFGKSALAWHWLLHDVPPSDWPRVVWWSFYEGDNSFENFVERTVTYLKAGNTAKLSPRQRVYALLDALHNAGTLLVLDGFERALRAFGGLNAAYQGDEAAKSETNERDCIYPLADLFLYHVALHPNLRSKVLLTTRLRPHVLEAKGTGLLQGCREEELNQMQPADAVQFFRAQGIRGTRAEIEAACEPYGYHPLSLRLLAGWIVGDLQQPGDIAAASRLDVRGDLVTRQHHVLAQAYDSLTPDRQKLLTLIACFRTPVTYDTLKALAETAEESPTTLDADLREVVSRGLLHHDTKEGRFDLHPIVRRYAYDRLAPHDRIVVHTRLRDYFAAVPTRDRVTCIGDLAPVIELYYHTVRASRYDEAFHLMADRLGGPLYYQFGAYQAYADLLALLFPDGRDCPPRLSKDADQAWTLDALANSYSLSGHPHRAVMLLERAIALAGRWGDKMNVAIYCHSFASTTLLPIGALRAAEANLRRSIALSREIKHEYYEAVGCEELALVLAYCGAYAKSEVKQRAALVTFERQDAAQAECVFWCHTALRALLLLRTAAQSAIVSPESAIASARRALELADETAHRQCAYELDFVRVHWLLGAAHRVAGHYDDAGRHLHEAIERCRRINAVWTEADILIDLARLRAATGSSDEAQRLAEEALVITERSGYVLQGADAHLELAKLALARGDKAAANEHAQKAKELATCDGPPDYTYKAAYDEACGLLEGQ